MASARRRRQDALVDVGAERVARGERLARGRRAPRGGKEAGIVEEADRLRPDETDDGVAEDGDLEDGPVPPEAPLQEPEGVVQEGERLAEEREAEPAGRKRLRLEI